MRPLTMLEYALSSAIGYPGGVSLVGGRGNVLSVVVGTLLIGILPNGMTIMDMDIRTQNIVKGIVLLIAIVIDS